MRTSQEVFANIFIAPNCSFTETKIDDKALCLPGPSHVQHSCHSTLLCQYLSQIAKEREKKKEGEAWICKNNSCYLPLTIGKLHTSLQVHTDNRGVCVREIKFYSLLAAKYLYVGFLFSAKISILANIPGQKGLTVYDWLLYHIDDNINIR